MLTIEEFSSAVQVHHLYPGLQHLVASNCEADTSVTPYQFHEHNLFNIKNKQVVILLAYGTGNGHPAIREYVKNCQNNTYFVCTECYAGKVESNYDAELCSANCMSLLDMTPAAAMAKASGLLNLVEPFDSFTSLIPEQLKKVVASKLKTSLFKTLRAYVAIGQSSELNDEIVATLAIKQYELTGLSNNELAAALKQVNRSHMYDLYTAIAEFDFAFGNDMLTIFNCGDTKSLIELAYNPDTSFTVRQFVQFMMIISYRGEIMNLSSRHCKDTFLLASV